MTVSRQKISAILRKAGLKASTWGKGRITWRASEGYDLQMVGFNGRIAEVGFNVPIGWNRTPADDAKEEAGLRAIEDALTAAGFQTKRERGKVWLVEAA